MLTAINKLFSFNTLLLILVVLAAAVLRFNQLGTNPPSLTWDEASWGYNAYSIGIDGRDEFGRLMPFDYLESFGDFKPPVYAYLDVIPVKIFGLNEFSTRFPSAFFGTLTVIVTYFLAKKLFDKSDSKITFKQVDLDIPLMSAFILAFSPWHIMLSRAAFEANISTFFIVTGVWLFLESLHRKRYLLLLSVFFFVLSIYTFNSARIVAPLILICLSIGSYKILLENKKALTVSIIVGLILILPAFKFLTSAQAGLRYKEVNIFSDINLIKNSNQEVVNDHNIWWSKMIHNRRVVYGREFLKHYFDNLSPQFLYISGDENPKFSTGDVGQMYLWDLPFILIGFLFLIRNKVRNWWIFFVWIIIGIIPAALARETPHALRIEGTLPVWQMITAYGFILLINSIKKYKKIAVAIFMIAFSFNALYFLHGYYSHYPLEHSIEWQYGYKESIRYVSTVENNVDKIYITNYLGRPYIYTLFYTKYDPRKFSKEVKLKRDIFGFVHVESFGKYFFPESIPTTKTKTKILYVDDIKSVPRSAKILKTFYILNAKPILAAYSL